MTERTVVAAMSSIRVNAFSSHPGRATWMDRWQKVPERVRSMDGWIAVRVALHCLACGFKDAEQSNRDFVFVWREASGERSMAMRCSLFTYCSSEYKLFAFFGGNSSWRLDRDIDAVRTVTCVRNGKAVLDLDLCNQTSFRNSLVVKSG